MKNHDKVAVLDFGGQYAHLIATRVRRLGVYSEIFENDVPAETLRGYKGVIFSGGPSSVRQEGSPSCDPAIFELGIPVLGICYGHQLMAKLLGGVVSAGKFSEYGEAEADFLEKESIFKGLADKEKVWMSHFDQVTVLPAGFVLSASTEDCPIAGMADLQKKFYGIQFHTEVTHTENGMKILENFLNLCRVNKDWRIEDYILEIEEEIKNKVGDKNVFLLISGGVDSTVAFLLLAKALGKERVYGLFVDTGLMRKNEKEEVAGALKEIGVDNLHVYDAKQEYLDALREVYEPEEKRKIIGDLFLKIQEKVSEDLNLNPQEWIIGQGTIYPDTIESGGTKNADKIKTHHNRVPKIQELILAGKVVEPLEQLYKDEVRLVGEKLGLKESMVKRHPFPGPGLGVRILCARSADEVENKEALNEELGKFARNHLLEAFVLPIKSVGVQGDERSYRHPVALFGEFTSWEDLSVLSTRLTNQFKSLNRVVFCLNQKEKPEFVTVKNCELSAERVALTQELDAIVRSFLKEKNLEKEVWQCPTVLVPVSLDGKKESVILRPVCSEEAMTANFYRMPSTNLWELRDAIMSSGLVSGIFYDLTNKPPGTIEWE